MKIKAEGASYFFVDNAHDYGLVLGCYSDDEDERGKASISMTANQAMHLAVALVIAVMDESTPRSFTQMLMDKVRSDTLVSVAREMGSKPKPGP